MSTTVTYYSPNELSHKSELAIETVVCYAALNGYPLTIVDLKKEEDETCKQEDVSS